jgi:hypothetical protein
VQSNGLVVDWIVDDQLDGRGADQPWKLCLTKYSYLKLSLQVRATRLSIAYYAYFSMPCMAAIQPATTKHWSQDHAKLVNDWG